MNIKYLIIFIAVISIMCSKNIKSVTVEGTGEDSKAGLVVNGYMLLDLPDKDKYVGKRLKVTGIVENDHQFKLKKYKKGEPVNQGFDMPVLTNIKSIEIIN